MMVYTVNAALEYRKIAFDSVCANQHVAFFASVNFPRMANRAVTAEVPAKPTVAGMIVRHHVRVTRNVFFHNLLESFARHHLHVERADLAAALDKRNHGSLVALVFAKAMRPIFLL